MDHWEIQWLQLLKTLPPFAEKREVEGGGQCQPGRAGYASPQC